MEVAVGVVASLAGLDMSQNLSYFAIPAAWACAHVPHLYAAICAGKAFDMANPRALKDGVAKSSTLSEERKQFITRIKSASDNGYETLGLFAAAVVAGNHAGLKVETLNALSWGYIASRLAFNFIYIYLGGIRKITPLRSVAWSISVFISLGLFITAGLNLKDAA